MKTKIKILKILRYCGLALLAGTFITSCSSMRELKSERAASEIKIDGSDEDWQGAGQYFPDEKVLIAAKNDDNYVYALIKTTDPATIRKFMAAGLTVWLNGEGDKSTPFGIRYPTGMAGHGGAPPQEKLQDNKDERDPERMRKNFEEMKSRALENVEILYDDGEDMDFHHLSEIRPQYGVELSLKVDRETLVYELAIPIKSEKPELKPILPKENSIGIGIVSGEFKRPDFAGGERMGGGMPPMGGGPMGGGGMGAGPMGGGMRGGGMRGNFSRDMEKSVKIWLDLKLSKSK